MPLVTNVLLIRHGQSKGNAERRFGGHTATPLSARGHKQAEATARTLKSESLTAIFSSDLARAMETARPLSRVTGLPVYGTHAFRERSVGVMEGLTFEDAAQQHPEQYAALLRRDLTCVDRRRELPATIGSRVAETRRDHRRTSWRQDRSLQSHRHNLHPRSPPHGRPRRTRVKARLDLER